MPRSTVPTQRPLQVCLGRSPMSAGGGQSGVWRWKMMPSPLPRRLGTLLDPLVRREGALRVVAVAAGRNHVLNRVRPATNERHDVFLDEPARGCPGVAVAVVAAPVG